MRAACEDGPVAGSPAADADAGGLPATSATAVAASTTQIGPGIRTGVSVVARPAGRCQIRRAVGRPQKLGSPASIRRLAIRSHIR